MENKQVNRNEKTSLLGSHSPDPLGMIFIIFASYIKILFCGDSSLKAKLIDAGVISKSRLITIIFRMIFGIQQNRLQIYKRAVECKLFIRTNC